MGISIIVGTKDGEAGAWLYDRTNERAIGPTFDDYEDADGFLRWLTGAGQFVYWDGPRDARWLVAEGTRNNS